MSTATITETEEVANADFANELRNDVVAIELFLSHIGRRRAISEKQSQEVAEHFGAERRAIGTSKHLYPQNQGQIKRISSILTEVRRCWLERTIGYRKGVRLLRKAFLPEWIAKCKELQAELDDALLDADSHYAEIMEAARDFLGAQLYNPNDYPSKFIGSVKISWGVYNFEPNEELLRLAPETYQREQQRVRKQFENAIAVYEQEAREQLSGLVGNLLEKLTGEDDGKKVKYTEAATTNLRDFFDRFEKIGVRSDTELNDLVQTAKDALGGVTMKEMKKSVVKRRSMADTFKEVNSQLDKMLTAAPVRSFDFDEME